MLDHLVALYRPFVDAFALIVHPAFAGEMRAWASRHEGIHIAEQAEPTGMLDAILLAAPLARELKPGMIWITWADQIGVLPATLARLADAESGSAEMIVPTVKTPEPYIHVDRDEAGRIVRIRQRREGDEMPATGESDMGLFAMRYGTFVSDLPAYSASVTRGAGTGERNFLPFVSWLAARSEVATIPCSDPMERVGINTPADLEQVADWLRGRRWPVA
jgi:bifunctional UDP-N-acetylglucosamine pyrophosphorylase/glucosamine-1-phosphate N-acetyltransferase